MKGDITAKLAEKVGQVSEEIGLYSDINSNAEALVRKLEDRLSNVLVPCDTSPVNKEEMSAKVHMADSISCQNDRFISVLKQMEDIIERIEL